MHKAVCFFACSFLSACTVNTSYWHPTMEADPAQLGMEALAYQNRLEAAYFREEHSNGLCQFTRPSYQSKDTDSYRRYRKEHSNRRNESGRSDFECFRLPDTDTADKVGGFAKAGFALSDLYCRTFFRRLALHTNIRRFDHNAINGAGTLASAILGLASAGSAATGAVGAAFGTLDSGFSNYDATFVVEADPSLLEAQVVKQQEEVESEFLKSLQDNKPSSYYDANKAIEKHAYFCTFYGMKSIINSDVAKSTVAVTPATISVDVAATGSLLVGYARSLSAKAKNAFDPKFVVLMSKLSSYVAKGKDDAKVDAQVTSLVSVLTVYQAGPKSDAEKRFVDGQIDATLKTLS